MKTFTASFFTAAWLCTSVLCDENAHAGLHRRQQLSDILANILPQQGNQGFNAVELLSKSPQNAGADSGSGGAITVTVDDVFGTRSQQVASSMPPNQGAIWVSSTAGGGGERTSSAGKAAPTAAPAQEGTTTIRSTISMTTTLTIESPTSNPPFPANATSPGAAAPEGATSVSLQPFQPIGTGGLPAQSALPTAPANALPQPQPQPVAPAPLQGPTAGTIPPIVQQPSAVPNGGSPLPGAAAPLPASGGVLPPILQPTNVPAGVFPPKTPPGSPPAAVAPAPVQSGAMAVGTGTIINGQCSCACNCPTNAFPSQVAAPPLGAPLQAPPAAIQTSATTLQTVILPSSNTQPLPSTLLVDTRLPPPLPTSAPVIAPPAQITQSAAPLLPTSALPIVGPPQSAVEPISTVPLGAPNAAPAPTPPPLPVQEPTINISTFSLVSSLVLALGG